MKPLLKKTKNSEIDFLLQGNLYESIYTKIQEVLSVEEASVFCRIERRKNDCIWYGEDGSKYRPSSELNEEEKIEVSDLLAVRQAAILPKLRANPGLAANADALFKVPTGSDIYQVCKPDGTIDVAISRWAIKLALSTSEADPIIKLINIPKPDRFPVTINIRYSDGASYAKEPFFFSYQDNSLKQFKTDEEGIFQLGRLKKERTFGIRQFEEGVEYTFTVDSEQSVYPVIFPRYTSFEVLVINQEETPISEQAIQLIHGEDIKVFYTDEEGLFSVESILLDNQPIELRTPDGEFSETYQLNIDTEQLIFHLKEKMYGEVTLLVKDQNGEPYVDYPVKVRNGAEEKEYKTQVGGRIELGQLEYETLLELTDGKTPSNTLSHNVEKGFQEIVMEVERPVIPPVKVQLINHKKVPISGIPLDFTVGGSIHQKETNEDGLAFLAKDIFTNGEKVKVGVHIKNKKGKEKLVKKSFKYDAEVSQYTIRLRKPNWWWLLLLLLLFLLIRCEKEVYVEVKEAGTNTPVSGATVHFDYEKAFVYDAGSPFTNDRDPRVDTTDANGIVHFGGLKYSVYSLIFKNKSTAITYAASNCFRSDTLSSKYHFIKNKATLSLKVYPIMAPMDFQVVDAEDGEPLPDAKVQIEAAYLDQAYVDSATTDPNGRVVFNNIPKCGLVNLARGSAEGYYPDEITQKDIPELSRSLDNDRTLRLKPIKKNLVFFVEDCKTGRRIPGAEVTLDFDFNGKKSTQKGRANVNGVGKGQYPDAHIIADVTLIGKAPPYYRDNTLPTYKVGDFIQLPDSLRTICLEPIANATTFKNIDSLTRQPLAGVSNEIKIENGGQTKQATVMSDKNGDFIVEINPGDVISIVSKYPPDYKDNATTIKDKDGIKLKEGSLADRTIPLSPIMTDLVFRTVDAANPSEVVPNSDISTQLSIRGQSISLPTPQKSDGKGEFIIRAPLVATISIQASKIGYGSNSTKISGLSFKSLVNSPQLARDIPLKKDPPPPPPPPPPPCESHVNSGGEGITINEYDMLNPKLKFNVTYDMQNQEDHLIIYCGRRNSQRILAQTPGRVSGVGRLDVDLSNCSSTWITVKVIGGSSGTEWDYSINCPN